MYWLEEGNPVGEGCPIVRGAPNPGCDCPMGGGPELAGGMPWGPGPMLVGGMCC